MSSFNNTLNGVITLFTMDLYKPIFKPGAKEQELVKAGRVMKDAGVVELTPWKYAKPFSFFMIYSMVAVYVFFSPIGVATVEGFYSPCLFIHLIAALAFLGLTIWIGHSLNKKYDLASNQKFNINQAFYKKNNAASVAKNER